ncbi:hypothetical protein HYDPIDRAFT_28269 [Hydnomerulius pinastri MD-312]|uniref:G-protein coupled receptors family 1 profile domain-containing protein n=1 Tax=Hydnomerulius pinastri MD-312 TaxID=994086 RepID=A0A0C9WFK7_9AGAM|nr:hypothetical protein HYDPIDRAFT_28269 [Hydnomerulius pinastri MD-312]
MSLTIPKAELTGVFLESLSYGVYLMVFNQCMVVLRKRHSRPSDYLVGTAVSLFILVTAHLVIDIVRNMEAFTSNMSTANYPTSYYGQFDTWKNIVKSALYVAVTLISDAFILYRSFIVWGRSYLIATIPFLLFLADIAIGVFWVYTLSLILPGENVFADALSVRVKTFYSITLAMNVMCTSLIAFKIWRIQRAVAPFTKGNEYDLSRLVAIIVESGSVYSALLVVMIATYTSNSPAMFIFLNTMSPIIGIVFSSVIVRVGLGLSHGDSHHVKNSHSGTRHRWTVRASARPTASDQIYSTSNLGPFPEGGVQVSLSQTVHTHIDGFPSGEADVEGDASTADFKSEGFHAV